MFTAAFVARDKIVQTDFYSLLVFQLQTAKTRKNLANRVQEKVTYVRRFEKTMLSVI